jgi:hypothetical protein
MFWTGFFAGFASCFLIGLCDHWYASYRIERRERAVLMALLLGGCQTAEQQDWARAEQQCRLSKPGAEPYDQCVRENFRAYRILSTYTPAPAQPPAAPSGPTVCQAMTVAPGVTNVNCN